MASDNLDSVELLGPSIMNDLPPPSFALLECALLVSVLCKPHLSFFLPKVTPNCRSSFYVTVLSPLFLEGGNLSDSSLLATSSFPKSCIESLSPVLHVTCLRMASSLSSISDWVEVAFL